jgi:hypothetical protein
LENNFLKDKLYFSSILMNFENMSETKTNNKEEEAEEAKRF